jgi:integrase
MRSTGATVAQRQLRHANARTTLETYGHVLADGHQDAMTQIESVLLATNGT